MVSSSSSREEELFKLLAHEKRLRQLDLEEKDKVQVRSWLLFVSVFFD